jgi:hypothetical protein
VFSEGPQAYHRTQYGSFNVVWQARKRLGIGLEDLYGHKEDKSGADGDASSDSTGVALFNI